MAKELNIIHFNDVYEINERKKEPIGGAARFATAMKSFDHLKPIVLFSGDVFNPSVTSTITKGKHMPPVLNKLNVKASVIGNHEFDFGPATLTKNIADCTFEWILSNVVDKDTNGQLVGSVRQTIIDWNGVKVGLLGLAEREWLDTINNIYTFAKYLDFVEEGKKITADLKKLGVDVVICLAHMRMPNAEYLADQIPGIDIQLLFMTTGTFDETANLVLLGHDHFYETKLEKRIILSGSDFRNLSVIKGFKAATDGKWNFEVKQVDITAAFAPDPGMLEVMKGTSDLVSKKLAKVIGEAGVELNAKNATVRTLESNLGNLISDIMREEMRTDAASVNGGNIRSDNIYGPGRLTLNDLISILPFENIVVMIKIDGVKFKEFLEAAVSRFPSEDGRFAQVSGVQFGFDPDQPAGSRVKWIEIGGKPIENTRKYTLALVEYIALGNDGYECLKGVPILTDPENGVLLSTMVRKYFIQMEVLAAMDKSGTSMAAALAKWLKRKTTYTFKPVVEGRIVNLKTHPTPPPSQNKTPSTVYFEFPAKAGHVLATTNDECAQSFVVVRPFDAAKKDGRLLSFTADGYIHFVANPNLVLDVSKEVGKEGARVVAYKKKSPPAKNQLWVNKDGVFFSKLADDLALSVDAEGHVVVSKEHRQHVAFINPSK